MNKLFEDCKNHSLAFLNRDRYRDINRKEYILEVYRCVECGAGQFIYIPKEEYELPAL